MTTFDQTMAAIVGVVAELADRRWNGPALTPLRLHDLADDLRDAAAALEKYADALDAESTAARAAKEG